MSSLSNWLVQLRQGSLNVPGFLRNTQEALAGGQLDPGALRAWLQTPAVKTTLPPQLLRQLMALSVRPPANAPVGASAASRVAAPAGLVPAAAGAGSRVRAAAPAGTASPQARQRPQTAVEASAGTAPAAGPQGPDIGSVIDGRYELIARLGGGGMGDVYKALDRLAHEQRDPDPYVAIKVLKARMQGNQKAVLALQREANRARRLTHSNILRVHQFEQDRETGQYFMVMEMLEGRSVEALMNDSPGGQPWPQIAPVLAQVCAGLSYAHQQGIIHSDIKPSNLFLTKNREVKILDFGIAAPVPSAGRQVTLMDARKLGARTPAYASMEAFLGLAPQYSDDVYSLAVLTYEWLSGRPPYANPKEPRSPVAAPAALRLKLQVPPLPELTRGQNRALRQALSLRHSERTATVDEFWKAMNEQAPAPSVPAAPAAGGRKRAVLAAAGGAALAMAAGGTASWLMPSILHGGGAAPGTSAGPVAVCPAPGSVGALDTALGAVRQARAALTQTGGATPDARTRGSLAAAVQCLRTLAGAGVSSPESAQLLREIDGGDAR